MEQPLLTVFLYLQMTQNLNKKEGVVTIGADGNYSGFFFYIS